MNSHCSGGSLPRWTGWIGLPRRSEAPRRCLCPRRWRERWSALECWAADLARLPGSGAAWNESNPGRSRRRWACILLLRSPCRPRPRLDPLSLWRRPPVNPTHGWPSRRRDQDGWGGGLFEMDSGFVDVVEIAGMSVGRSASSVGAWRAEAGGAEGMMATAMSGGGGTVRWMDGARRETAI